MRTKTRQKTSNTLEQTKLYKNTTDDKGVMALMGQGIKGT